jgi:Protein of unknown function DUF86
LPSDKPLVRLYDILENIDRIRRYTENYTFARFADDSKCQDAVERCLLRISEAAGSSKASLMLLLRNSRGPTFARSEMYCGTNTTRWIPQSSGKSSRKTLCH